MKENEYFKHIYHDLTVNNTGIIYQENIHPIHVLQWQIKEFINREALSQRGKIFDVFR